MNFVKLCGINIKTDFISKLTNLNRLVYKSDSFEYTTDSCDISQIVIFTSTLHIFPHLYICCLVQNNKICPSFGKMELPGSVLLTSYDFFMYIFFWLKSNQLIFI